MMKFFLVDDDAAIRGLLRSFLEYEFPEAKIEEAVNGLEARDKLLECPDEQLPDLVLTDMEMPGLNGIQLITALRNSDREKVRALKIVLATGLVSEKIKMEAAKWYCWFLQKPVGLSEFQLLLKEALN